MKDRPDKSVSFITTVTLTAILIFILSLYAFVALAERLSPTADTNRNTVTLTAGVISSIIGETDTNLRGQAPRPVGLLAAASEDQEDAEENEEAGEDKEEEKGGLERSWEAPTLG